MESFEIFLGWPRQYNYWDKKKERWHRVSGSYVTREDAEALFRRGIPFGVTKCFGNMGECQNADVFTIEVDAPCGDILASRDRLRCVAEHSRDVVEVVANMKPLLYWNGGKSLYVIFPLEYPVPATYIPRTWVTSLLEVFPNVDRSQLSFNTTFRVPLTPHPRFKHRGEFLDEGLRPSSFHIRRISPTYVVEPASTHAPQLSTSAKEWLGEIQLSTSAKEWLGEIKKWVEEKAPLRLNLQAGECRKRLAMLWGCGCRLDGVQTPEECVEMFRQLLASVGASLKASHVHAIKYYFKACKDGPKFSLRKAVTCEGEVWYCLKQCIETVVTA
jgi:hypothetical protein